MKLLDLQEGKYLERSDWALGENFIMFHNYYQVDIDNENEDWCELSSSEYCRNGFHLVIQRDYGRRMNIEWLDTESQEPLKTLCEKTGAVVYGGRYVLFISNERDSYNNWCGDLMISCEELFEEYSKQLRNEPNKFEELTELIK